MRKYPNEEFYPTKGQAGATQDFVHTFETSIRKAVIGLFFGLIVGPKLFGKEIIEGETLKEKQADLESALDKLEKILAAYGGEYLTGENFTLADLSIFTTLSHALNNDLASIDGRAEIKAWYERSAEQKVAKAIQAEIADFWKKQEENE